MRMSKRLEDVRKPTLHQGDMKGSWEAWGPWGGSAQPVAAEQSWLGCVDLLAARNGRHLMRGKINRKVFQYEASEPL